MTEPGSRAPAAQRLPFAVGARVCALRARVDARKTEPAARYTDGTLIADMASAHRFVTDPALRSVLKDNQGIGTERTRAAIIEKCLADGLLRRQGKHLLSTPAAREVHARLDAAIKSPEISAKWELALATVAEGRATAEQFMDKQEAFVRDLVRRAVQADFSGCALARKAA